MLSTNIVSTSYPSIRDDTPTGNHLQVDLLSNVSDLKSATPREREGEAHDLVLGSNHHAAYLIGNVVSPSLSFQPDVS